MSGLVVDLFAGGGGASTGIEAALGRSVDIAINHDPIAMAVHQANHPATEHLTRGIWDVDPEEAARGRPVQLLWASPDCTHFSVAKGGKPRRKKIRSLAWAVVRWATKVRPSVICLENVREFQGWGPLDRNGHPIRARMGETFDRWRRKLERLGYVVDHRILDASLYGAPTRRRRLFLVARCDGQPIRWPAPTHGKGLRPLRTAAECIDWSIPCPSIFTRKKPLAEKTLWRIAEGIRRFVIENPRPFIVKVNHGDDSRTGSRVSSIDEPLTTVTATSRGHAIVAPVFAETGNSERAGQAPRCKPPEDPSWTVTANGSQGALVAAYLAKHFTDRSGGFVGGQQLEMPIGTVTTRDHHGPVAATLVKFRGEETGADPNEPVPTISAGGGKAGRHVAEVRAFLTAFYGTDGTAGKGQDLFEPMRTMTAKHRLGLVTVEGINYQIVDIGMRMLEPHELLCAQFGRFAPTYDLSAARTKSDKVRLIGNSVCPEVAEALIRANLPAAGLSRRAA